MHESYQKGENSRGKSYVELDYKGHGEIAVGLLKTGTALPKYLIIYLYLQEKTGIKYMWI